MREAVYGSGVVECRVLHGGEEAGPPVLLLHGYSFRGSTWAEIGLLDELESHGYRYAAPDMPYGRSTECTKRSRSVELNVEMARVVSQRFLGDERPLIVGASLGGRIALYYAAMVGSRGLFLASPALKEDERVWDLLRLIRGVPVVVVRGSRDFVPWRVHRKLAKKLGVDVIVYEGAGHAMYLDLPDRFKRDVLDFLERNKEK